jgi:AcrR family transcriptional regulator
MSKDNGNSSAAILDAALQLFSEKGYEATSIREICNKAGITRPTLYYFYQSKEGVYRALMHKGMKEFEHFMQLGFASEGSLRANYKASARACFKDAVERPKLWRFIFTLVWAPDVPFAKELHKWYVQSVRRAARAAEAAVRRGEIAKGDTRVRMLVIMGALGEAFSDFLIFGRPKLTAKLADSIVDTVFDGWQPQTARIRNK